MQESQNPLNQPTVAPNPVVVEPAPVVVEPKIETVTTETVLTPVNTPKKSNKGLCFILVFLFFGVGFIGLALAGGYLYGQMKSKYVPYLSPVFEDVINTPAEQLSLRLDAYSSVIDSLSEEGNAQPSGNDPMMDFFGDLTSMDSEAEVNLTYIITEPMDSVLGLDITAGELDDQNMMAMLSATSGEVNIFTNSIYQFVSEEEVSSKGSVQMQFKAGGKEIGMEMETLQIVSSADQEMFLKLIKFPETEYIVTDQFLNKWIRFSTQDLLSYSTESYLYEEEMSEAETEDLLQETMDQLQVEIPRIKQLLATESFGKALTIADPITANNESLKCYNFHIDSTNAPALMADIVRVYEIEDYEQQDLSTLPAMDIKLCFDSLLMVKRVSMDMDAPSSTLMPGADIKMSAYFQLNSFNQAYTITAPTANVIEYTDIDWVEVMPLMYMYPEESSYDDFDYGYDDYEDIDFDESDLDFDFDL